ncbi:MAG: toll/interleukin-1 receptor domain-containing protein [Alphaproteobacteria bacterium]|nr:toll/interleukin-1 receptor domain-containing protein [Alphaproteobacteria bacterium]
MKVFLSHASNDKPIVTRINKDLRTHGISTWVDHKIITGGDGLPERIQVGLAECSVLLLFMSRHSMVSPWVNAEWNNFFTRQMDGEPVVIVPIRIDKEAQRPGLLRHLLYIDFAEPVEYETALSNLLRSLSKTRTTIDGGEIEISPNNVNVSRYTKELLEDLNDEFISLPSIARIPIIDKLKQLPRSGKKVRISGLKPKIRIRSIYDHILSIAHSADVLLPVMDHNVKNNEYSELARCIAFHELNEVVLGDIPTYTPLSENKRKSARIYAENRLRSIPPNQRQKIADEFIWMFLQEKNRASLSHVNTILNNENPISVTFRLLDKIDPIVAIWRYLHTHRNSERFPAEGFLRRTKDFFENPDVKNFARSMNFDNKVYNLILDLQDRNKALSYFENPDYFSESKELFSLPHSTIKELIEGREIIFTEFNRKPSRPQR